MAETYSPVPFLTTEITTYPSQTIVVVCRGRLITGLTDQLMTTVRPLFKTSKRVILDLADLKHTDSSGLGTLVRLYVAAKSEGSSLELMHLSKQIRNLLGMTNLFDVFVVIGEKGVKFM